MAALNYLAQLLALLPVGAAWPRDQDTLLARTLHAWADGLARADARAVGLLDEAVPSAAYELLSDWERVLGLPNPCGGVAQTIQERQAAAGAALTAVGGQSIAYYIDLAARLGYAITIDEFPPFCADESSAEDLLSDDSWGDCWVVRAPGDSTIREFCADESAAEEPLRVWGDSQLDCAIRRARPAHTTVFFDYGEGLE